MEVLNLRIDKKTKERIERLVRRGAFKNKSDAVRKMLERHFEEHPELLEPEDLESAIRGAEDMPDEQFERLASKIFSGSKTAAELLAEERERFQ